MFFTTLIVFILYFTTLTGIGFYFSKKIKTSNDYLIAAHTNNYWVTAIAAQASDMGGWLFLGFPAAIYVNGLFEFWTAIGLIVCMYCNWQWIAPRLRKKTTTESTLAEFFEKQTSDASGMVRLVSSLISLIFFTFYIASGLVGLGLVFESAFGINYHLGICLGLSVTILYTLLGGFAAIAWCDLVQGIFLLCMIILVPVYTYISTGSISSVIDTAKINNISLSLFSNDKSIFNALMLAFGWGLGYFGQPHVLSYFMSIDDPKKISYAKYIGMAWQITVLFAAAAIGILGMGFFHYPIKNTELLFIQITQGLFNPLLVALVLCAILAAAISTLDSHVLISGSTFANDIWRQFNKKSSDKTIIFISRLASIIICLVATWYAWSGSDTIYKLVNYAWSGLGSSFGPLLIMCLYAPKVTKNMALSGLITGALVSGIWPYFGTSVLPLIPGFFTNILTMYIVSKIEK